MSRYGISMPAVKMRKIVQVVNKLGTKDFYGPILQVYQWYETEDSVTAGREAADNHIEKSYSYYTDWLDHHVDSSNFASSLGNNTDCLVLYHYVNVKVTTTPTRTPGLSTRAS